MLLEFLSKYSNAGRDSAKMEVTDDEFVSLWQEISCLLQYNLHHGFLL